VTNLLEAIALEAGYRLTRTARPFAPSMYPTHTRRGWLDNSQLACRILFGALDMFADNHPADWDTLLDDMAEEADRMRDEEFADARIADCEPETCADDCDCTDCRCRIGHA
jgi:hypothetical protein